MFWRILARYLPHYVLLHVARKYNYPIYFPNDHP